MALFITVLIISLLLLATVQFAREMRAGVHAAANLKDSIRLSHAAKSAFNYALAILMTDVRKNEFDSLGEDWADREQMSANAASLFEDGGVDLQVTDHSGRIQLNALIQKVGSDWVYNEKQRILLVNFLKSEEFGIDPGDVEVIVDSIKDWLDEDSEETGFEGAEEDYYRSLPEPYSCKNGPMDFLEELLLVRGIDRNIFYGTEEVEGIADYLTVYGNDGKININTAEPLVLRALSEQLDREMAEAMDNYRRNEKSDLADLQWYRNVPEIPGDVSIDSELITNVGTYFEIRAAAFLGNMKREVSGVARRGKTTGMQVLTWKID